MIPTTTIQSHRDYDIYIYGLEISGIEYTSSRSTREISVPLDFLFEIEIQKKQHLSGGVFSVERGLIPDIPILYDLVYQTEDADIYRVKDPKHELLRGSNAQSYIQKTI